MPIETVTAFRVVCHRCGAWGPLAITVKIAGQRAESDGWSHDMATNNEWICPECQRDDELAELVLDQG